MHSSQQQHVFPSAFDTPQTFFDINSINIFFFHLIHWPSDAVNGIVTRSLSEILTAIFREMYYNEIKTGFIKLISKTVFRVEKKNAFFKIRIDLFNIFLSSRWLHFLYGDMIYFTANEHLICQVIAVLFSLLVTATDHNLFYGKNCDADNKWHSANDYDTSGKLRHFLSAQLYKSLSTNLMIHRKNREPTVLIIFTSNSIYLFLSIFFSIR